MRATPQREAEYAEVCWVIGSLLNASGVVEICQAGGQGGVSGKASVGLARQCVVQCGGVGNYIMASPNKEVVLTSAQEVS